MSNWLAILLGVLVNCIWATAYLVPYYYSKLDPTAIAVGRYLVYGIISLFLYLLHQKKGEKLTRSQWKSAFWLALTGNVGYYILLALAIHYAGITLSALIIGIIPVTMIITGSLLEKNFNLRLLFLPILLILSGIVILNISKISVIDNRKAYHYLLLGLIFSTCALLLWTGYGVYNSLFLKENNTISAQLWSQAVGICCLLQSLAVIPALIFFQPEVITELINSHLVLQYILSCLFLGGIVSWLATIWWNKVSRNLSITIVGQLIVFETLASLFYGYLIDNRLPSLPEVVSTLLILSGVYIGIKRHFAADKVDGIQPA